MKRSVRFLSLVLALMMLVSAFVACGNDTGNDDDSQTTASTSNGGENVKELPALNWEGQEFRILGRESTTAWAHNFEVYRDELPEDVVGKAVYERNENIYNKYGITIAGTLTSGNNSSAKTMLESGEDLYDMLILSPEAHHPLAMQGYLLDMNSLDYVNMDHNGWIDYNNEQLSVGGNLYYTSNKFLLQDKHRSFVLFYNRDYANELNLGHFEDMVFDGTWTIDKVVELGKQATADTDGQPGMTKEDNWGVAAAEYYNFCQWSYGAGFRFTEKDASGYPVLIGATDQMLQILDKVYGLVANTEVYFCDQDYGSVNWEDCADHAFYDGRVLILTMAMSTLEMLPEKTEIEFGVLPNPKFNEDQENYYALPNLGNGSLFSIPATIMDTAFTGFGLEALTEESVDTSYNAYIETKSKLQDAYDEDCAKCLDIIFNGIVYDIAFVSNVGDLGSLMQNTMGGLKTNTYARLYKSLSKIAGKQFDSIRESYSALG